MKPKIKGFLLKVVIVMIAVTLMTALVITFDGMHDRVTDSDLAIVPGNTVTADGKPSRRLQGRLDAAIELYRNGRCKTILVSGGIGAEGFDEAQVMKSYLVEHGVMNDHVYVDNKGINTFETARFAADLIRSKGMRNPILVSQFFHISRFRLAMKKQGVEVGGNVHSHYYELRDIYSTFREVFGYFTYAIR